MFQVLRNAWKITDLRKKILYTLFIILIFRIGSAITIPFIDAAAIANAVNSSNTGFEFLTLMSGGGFSNGSIFALSITPYINASIIIQLLTVAIPPLERMAKDGEAGRKKLGQITRYTTVILGLMLGVAYYFMVKNKYNALSADAKSGFGLWFGAIVIVLCFTAGSALMMWLGEQINEKGIGNGISILLFAGIISRIPTGAKALWTWFYDGGIKMLNTSGSAAVKNVILVPIVLVLFLGMIAFIVFMNDAERRIPVQYAKRVVGRKMYGGQSTYIPMKINSTGVMPLIFGFAILQFPATIFAFFPTSGINVWWQSFQSGIWYQVVLAVLIIAFTYFYTSITFNPVDISKNMQQNGGIIPGIRQGRATSDYLSRVSGRLTLFSALFLAVLATIPTMLTRIFGITAPFGASSVLIAVSVGIETIRQVEAQMVMRHHKGFLG